MNGRTPVRRGSGGFTLVELLVALTVMALVMGLLTNSLQFSLKAAGAVEAEINGAVSAHQGQRAFRRQLQMAMPVRRAGSDELDFSASKDAVEFVSALPGLTGTDGLYHVALRIIDGQLLMSYRSFIDTREHGEANAEPGEAVLLQGFERAQFSFLDARRVAAVEWADEWRYTDRLPDAVRLQITYGDASDTEPFDLVVAIKAPSPTAYGAS